VIVTDICDCFFINHMDVKKNRSVTCTKCKKIDVKRRTKNKICRYEKRAKMTRKIICYKSINMLSHSIAILHRHFVIKIIKLLFFMKFILFT